MENPASPAGRTTGFCRNQPGDTPRRDPCTFKWGNNSPIACPHAALFIPPTWGIIVRKYSHPTTENRPAAGSSPRAEFTKFVGESVLNLWGSSTSNQPESGPPRWSSRSSTRPLRRSPHGLSPPHGRGLRWAEQPPPGYRNPLSRGFCEVKQSPTRATIPDLVCGYGAGNTGAKLPYSVNSESRNRLTAKSARGPNPRHGQQPASGCRSQSRSSDIGGPHAGVSRLREQSFSRRHGRHHRPTASTLEPGTPSGESKSHV